MSRPDRRSTQLRLLSEYPEAVLQALQEGWIDGLEGAHDQFTISTSDSTHTGPGEAVQETAGIQIGVRPEQQLLAEDPEGVAELVKAARVAAVLGQPYRRPPGRGLRG